MFKLFRVVMALFMGLTAHVASAATPSQYMAKLYSEALGRAPDPGGWNGLLTYYANNACSVTSLKAQGQSFFTSQEFSNISYSNAAKVLILFRTILDREPDIAGFNNYLNQLNSGTPLAQVVNNLYNSAEFTNLKNYICGGGPYYFNRLGAGSFAIDIPGVATLTQSQLQAYLNNAGPNGTVALNSMTVVHLSSTLVIPNDVTLTTVGNPGPNAHGSMARIVRGSNYSGSAALIQIQPGGKLRNVWVDGQRGAQGFGGSGGNPIALPYVFNDINIQALSGTNTDISYNFISNTAGWSSLQLFGVAEITNTPCQTNRVVGNVITAYASSNLDTQNNSWADGISDSCEDSLVSNNHIIDATDGGIVLFRSQIQGVGAVQRSQVIDNTIVNAGNSGFVGIAVDPLYVTGGCPVGPSFAGSYVGRNALWTGPNAAVTIALAVGTSEWFFNSGGCVGTGANVSDNTTAGLIMRANDGIAVQGMRNATVQSNNLLLNRTSRGSCASRDVPAGVSAGIASGAIQPYTDIALTNCIN